MVSGIHSRPSPAILAVAGLALAAPAGADGPGFYVGASLGLSVSGELCEGGPYDLGCNDDALAGKAFVGYRLNRFLGVEAGAMKGADVARGDTVSVSRAGVDLNYTETDTFSLDHSASLAIRAYAPFFENLEPFAKIGFHRYAVSYKYETSTSLVGLHRRENGSALLVGVGAQYPVSGNMWLRAEWENRRLDYRLWREDRTNAFSAGVSWRF